MFNISQKQTAGKELKTFNVNEKQLAKKKKKKTYINTKFTKHIFKIIPIPTYQSI